MYELLWGAPEPPAADAKRGAKRDGSASGASGTPDGASGAPDGACESPRWCLRRIAAFGSPRFDTRSVEALHILSADSRFPDLKLGDELPNGNHFLCLIPCDSTDDERAATGALPPAPARAPDRPSRTRARVTAREHAAARHTADADGADATTSRVGPRRVLRPITRRLSRLVHGGRSVARACTRRVSRGGGSCLRRLP